MEIYPILELFMICDPSTRRLDAMIQRQSRKRLPINYPEAFRPHLLNILLIVATIFLTHAPPNPHQNNNGQTRYLLITGLQSRFLYLSFTSSLEGVHVVIVLQEMEGNGRDREAFSGGGR